MNDDGRGHVWGNGNVLGGATRRPREDDDGVDDERRETENKRQRTGAGRRVAEIDANLRFVKVEPPPGNDPRNNVHSVSLRDILHEGDIAEMWQFNYMLEVPFFIANLPEACRNLPIHFVIHDGRAELDQISSLPNADVCGMRLDQFGTHHSKAMFIFYRDNTCRVIIHTANLIFRDWGKKTQACWISDPLPKKSRICGSPASSTPSRFEADLIAYLSHYKRSTVTCLIDRLSTHDFSSVRADIVASVPGRFKASENTIKKWGHMRLRELLKEVTLSRDVLRESSIIMQYSSWGSLGSTDSWFMKEFGAGLQNAKNRRDTISSGKVKIVYPTSGEVQRSNQGWGAGKSMPFNDKHWQSQKGFIRKYLHGWKASRAGRDYCMPHIKTFARVNETTNEVAWLVVGSHNLSKAAWGSLEKQGAQLFIRSYELGVFIHPEYFKAQGLSDIKMLSCSANDLVEKFPLDSPKFPNRKTVHQNDDGGAGENGGAEAAVVHIRLPYDLPVTPYVAQDEPWRWDVAFAGVDDFGQTCSEA